MKKELSSMTNEELAQEAEEIGRRAEIANQLEQEEKIRFISIVQNMEKRLNRIEEHLGLDLDK